MLKIYRRYKNFCNNLLKRLKKEFDQSNYEKVKNNIKGTWKFIKKTCNLAKSPQSSQNLLCSANDGYLAVCQANKYFASIGDDLAMKFKNCEDNVPNFSNSCKSLPRTSMTLYSTSYTEVDNTISSLKNTSATGWDGIPTSIIKLAKHVIIPLIVHIFNLSVASGIFPKAFKKALIHPIYKAGDSTVINNYRPISVLSTVSKIFEKLLNARLVNYLDSNNLISNNQYGFRKGKSTADAVLDLTTSIVKGFDGNQKVIGLFLDLSKAFDTVSIPKLLDRLDRMGIRGVVNNIFLSYLTDRAQCVVIDDIVSTEEIINIGVPQGSVLGPTLFLIYVNELSNLSIPNCKIVSYADDTALLIHGRSWSEARNLVESSLATVHNWLTYNKLTLNLEKTKFVTFAPHNNTLPSSPISIKAHIKNCVSTSQCNCINLCHTTHIKYLGVWFDETLSWKEHIDVMCKRLRKMVYIFKILRSILGYSSLIGVYYALVQSILSYCIIAWGGIGKTKMLRLERTQRYILKVMLHKPSLFSTAELYREANILSVRKLFILNSILRKHSQTPYNKQLIISKRRSDLVCKTHYSRLALCKQYYEYLAPNMYNKINKIINIYPRCLRACKRITSDWLKGMTYEETENLIII